MPKTRFRPEEMGGINRLVLHLHEPGWASDKEWNRGALAWMEQEGWQERRGMYPAWLKPVAPRGD